MGQPHSGDAPISDRAQVALDVILGRRSVRESFASAQVPRNLLEKIARCGLAAPSSKGAQPWRLHLVTGRAILDRIADLMESSPSAGSYVPRDPTTGALRPQWESTVVQSAAVLRRVPAGVFVENRGVFSGGRATLAAAPGASLIGYSFEVLGIGAAVQNMWLAAHALGISGAFMGDVLVEEERIRAVLHIRGDLLGVLALGYSETPAAEQRRPRAGDDELIVWHEG